MANEQINVGQTVPYVVDWLDQFGKPILDTAAATWSSDNNGILSVNPTAIQSADVTGVAAGTTNLNAVSSNGVAATPLAFDVAAAAAPVITSGIIRRGP